MGYYRLGELECIHIRTCTRVQLIGTDSGILNFGRKTLIVLENNVKLLVNIIIAIPHSHSNIQ